MEQIPSIVVELGRAVEIKTGNGSIWEFSKADNFVICSPLSGKGKLFIFSKKGSTNTKKVSGAGSKLREEFTGKEPTKNRLVKVPDVTLKKLGTCAHVVYESDKFEKEYFHYIHSFTKRPDITCDNTLHPSLLVISGPQIRINERGIIG